ncbi:hypothetical protein PRIC2_013639 [Phytophthora ramorum]
MDAARAALERGVRALYTDHSAALAASARHPLCECVLHQPPPPDWRHLQHFPVLKRQVLREFRVVGAEMAKMPQTPRKRKKRSILPQGGDTGEYRAVCLASLCQVLAQCELMTLGEMELAQSVVNLEELDVLRRVIESREKVSRVCSAKLDSGGLRKATGGGAGGHSERWGCGAPTEEIEDEIWAQEGSGCTKSGKVLCFLSRRSERRVTAVEIWRLGLFGAVYAPNCTGDGGSWRELCDESSDDRVVGILGFVAGCRSGIECENRSEEEEGGNFSAK